jgi:hypothetical protein
MISTGTLSRAARTEAVRDGAPAIDLVDGQELTDILKQYELGVQTMMVEKVEVNAAWCTTICPGTQAPEGRARCAKLCPHRADPRTGADAQEPPLVPRSGYRARLTAGVDMTSEVKSREHFGDVCLVFALRPWQSRSQ